MFFSIFYGRHYVNRLVGVSTCEWQGRISVCRLVQPDVRPCFSSQYDASSFYCDTSGIWTIGVAEQICSGQPGQPETRKTGSIQAGQVLFDIPHLINTCININIYMTICILINLTQSPLTLSSSRVSFPSSSPCSSTFFPLQISTNKLATMKDILYIYFGSYVTYCYLSVK